MTRDVLEGSRRQCRPAMLAMLFGAYLATVSVGVHAASPAAGEYATEGGWGSLTVSMGANGVRSFSLDSVGGNMHTCSLGGEIADEKASLDVGESEPCVVRFTPGAAGSLDVGGDPSCRYFCGARASFEGVYFPVPDGCGSKAREATRGSFKRLYDRKEYAQARTTLQPLLERCGRLLDRWDEGWIRNDLALTQHKLGDDAGCRGTLAPLADDAGKTDEEISEEYPPSDAEAWLPIVRATRTNLRLCGAGKRG